MTDDKIQRVNELLNETELIKKISPKFEELSFDIREIMQFSENPAFLAALMFKLAQERQDANKKLDLILEKFDSIMLELKTKNTSLTTQQSLLPHVTGGKIDLLPEQDKLIIQRATESGQVTAAEIKAILGYRGLNAASQRLNKLYKEGHLKKIQSGKKVYYLANV